MGTEIERKYLCKVVRSPRGDHRRIDQRYLLASKSLEVRLRSVGDNCFFTVKTGGGMVRGEWEWSIPSWLFRLVGCLALWRIEKTRYVAGSWEVDIYPDLPGLAVAEVELPAESHPAPPFPDWIDPIEEVTWDPRWKNKKLAKDGFPKRRNDG